MGAPCVPLPAIRFGCADSGPRFTGTRRLALSLRWCVGGTISVCRRLFGQVYSFDDGLIPGSGAVAGIAIVSVSCPGLNADAECMLEDEVCNYSLHSDVDPGLHTGSAWFRSGGGGAPYMIEDEPLDEHVAQSASDEEQGNPEPGPYLGASSARLHVPSQIISFPVPLRKRVIEGTYVRSWLTLTGAANDASTLHFVKSRARPR